MILVELCESVLISKLSRKGWNDFHTIFPNFPIWALVGGEQMSCHVSHIAGVLLFVMKLNLDIMELGVLELILQAAHHTRESLPFAVIAAF